MSIVQTTIARAFQYNGIRLSDVSPEKTPDQIRAIYAGQYPELLTAVVEGPVTKNGVSVYTFARAAGSKGAGHLAALRQIVTVGMPNASPLATASENQLLENKKCSQIVQTVVSNQARTTPLLPQAAAYSLFG